MSRFRVNFTLKLLIPLTVCLRDHCGLSRRDNWGKRATNGEITTCVYMSIYVCISINDGFIVSMTVKNSARDTYHSE